MTVFDSGIGRPAAPSVDSEGVFIHLFVVRVVKIAFTSKLMWDVVSDSNYASLVLFLRDISCTYNAESGHLNNLRDSIGESRLHIDACKVKKVTSTRFHGYVLFSFSGQRSRE